MDGASRPDDLPAQFRGHPTVMVVQSTHGMLANITEVERDIAMKMASENQKNKPGMQ